MKRLICILLVLCLPLCSMALAEVDDPVVVRVGDFSYTQSQLQASLDNALEISEMLRTCNRMAIMRDGEKVGELDHELTQENVMKAIAGGEQGHE